MQIGTRLTKRQAAGQRKLGKSEVEIHIGTRDRLANITEMHSPYMRPAWDKNKNRALETIKSDLGTEIDKAARRVAKRAAKRAGAS